MQLHNIVVSLLAGLAASEVLAQYPPPVPEQLRLIVRETAGIARTQEVTRSGIPLPRGLNVRDFTTLSVVDENERPVPAEFKTLARWDAGLQDDTAPIQWLLVTFPASVPANSSVVFRLVTDGSAGPNPAFANPLVLAQQGNRVTVDTGAAIFTIDGDAGALFSRIALPNGSVLVNGGNLTAQAVLPGSATSSPTTYAAARRVYVEHLGPLAAVVVVEGVFDLPTVGGGALSTRLRYVFTAGSPTVIVRKAVNWEGSLYAWIRRADGEPNGLRLTQVRDTLTLGLAGPFALSVIGDRNASPVQTVIESGQSAWLRQTLRENRTDPLSFNLQAAQITSTGAKATGGLLSVGTGAGSVTIALNHMHRYEPQALRLLPDSSLAIDVVDDRVWLAERQGLFATMAISVGPSEVVPEQSLAGVWAPLNRPLRAWPEAALFAASQAVDEFPAGDLPPDLALYDSLILGVLNKTLRLIDEKGLAGLQTFGLYPRHWGNPVYSDELGASNPLDDPQTPGESWDDLFWGATWTDYHNTVATAPVWTMRSGQVEWLDEIAFPGAMRQLHTQIYQGAPDDPTPGIGEARSGYGGYRADNNGSHAYFDNLFLYYWLTGDQTVVETLQRGASFMRAFLCRQRPGSPCAPAEPPADTGIYGAQIVGRVASQWNAAFRFVGLASSDPSFLEDYKANLARAVTQNYVEAVQDGTAYGFLVEAPWGNDPYWQSNNSWSSPYVNGPGEYQTSQSWLASNYDLNNLYRLSIDTDDAPIGQPPVRPSWVISAWARTLARFVTRIAPDGDGTVEGRWANMLRFTWTGPRIGGVLTGVSFHTIPGADPSNPDNWLYRDNSRAMLCAVLQRAGDFTGNAGLRQLSSELARDVIRLSWREGDPLPLSKIPGEALSRLHAAVARLATESAPTLNIRREGEEVILSWTSNSAPFTLETTASLTPPVWLRVEIVPGATSITIPASENTAFFQLRRSP